MKSALRKQVEVGRCGVVLTVKRRGDLVLANPHLIAWRERQAERGASHA